MAPVGQTFPQVLQLVEQAANRGVITGVKMPSNPALNHTGCRVLVGHAFMHSPQRMHLAKNSASGVAPGGRMSSALTRARSRLRGSG